MKRGVLALCLLPSLLILVGAQRDNVLLPGRLDSHTMLPNGWKLTPAGTHTEVGDLPLRMMLTPDRRYMLVATNGYNHQGLTLLDINTGKVAAHAPLWQTWAGMDLRESGAGGAAVYLSGGRSGKVHVVRYALGRLAVEDALPMPDFSPQTGYLAGVAVVPARELLLVLNSGQDTLYFYDLKARTVRSIPTRYHPYGIVADKSGAYAWVSNWGDKSVSRLDIEKAAFDAPIPTGDHPSDLVLTADARTLFVANSNSDTVSSVDTASQRVRETIGLHLTPRTSAAKDPAALQGALPNGLGLSPDGRTLTVANAGHNNVAIVDISEPGQSRVMGYVPTGWYPTSTAFDAAGKRLFVGSGKGLGSSPNPAGPNPTLPPGSGREYQYIRRLIPGSVSVVDVPDTRQLARHTEQVMANSPYRDDLLQVAAGAALAANSVVPPRVGGPSPVKYVLYIIKENRTYDQVFGALKEGNGDPSLVLFGENVTPNHHKIAREFVLIDNFYVSGDVSVDGHAWSAGAFVTDYHDKQWPAQYSQRGRMMVDPLQRLARPRAGYIWERAEQKGLKIRSYGEMTGVASLKDKFADDYRAKDPDKPWRDSDRANVFLREFEEFERNGNLPQFIIMSLPENHTSGTRPGAFTPVAQVASNDLALGRIVERVSRSRYWKEMAIFVVEDDAQNGPDHVDSHRSVAMVISPWSRLKRVDSTFYTTCSVLRTMELLLGLEPLTQYDAAAYPMFRSFGRAADMTPYTSVPARVDLNAKNPDNAFGARASMAMNFDEVDQIPEQVLNEILWKSVRGEKSEMPPPVRRLLPAPLYTVSPSR